MATWDDVLTQRDKEVFALSGYGKRAGFGQRPAVLVIDVNYNFVGDKPEPILESVSASEIAVARKAGKAFIGSVSCSLKLERNIYPRFTRPGITIEPIPWHSAGGRQKTAARPKT